MKHLRTIFPVAAIVLAIVAFWLIPNINKAKTLRYTRIYENTDTPNEIPGVKTAAGQAAEKQAAPKPEKASSDKTFTKEGNPGKAKKKLYKKEHLEPKRSWKKVNHHMFSRAIHFRPEELVELDSVVSDTVVAVMPE